MTLRILILSLGFLPPLLVADAGQVAVPNGLLDVAGNTYFQYPFYRLQGPIRFQQVYHSSQFSTMPSNGAFITFISFRADCTTGSFDSVTNLQVRLSTTQRTPGTLSTNFASNVSSDETIVATVTNYFPPSGGGITGCPHVEAWAGSFWLSTAFFYNPSKGNLLLEIRHSGMGGWNVPPGYPEYRLDAQSGTDNSVRCLYSTPDTATNGTVASLGVVTLFSFETMRMFVWTDINGMNVALPRYISESVIQTTSMMGSNAQWLDYNGPFASNNRGYKRITIPLQSITNDVYYRAIYRGTVLQSSPLSPP